MSYTDHTKNIRLVLFSIVAGFLALTNLSAQNDKLNQALNNFLNAPVLNASQLGISIKDIETGEFILGHDEERNFIPASTLKVLYTLAAYDQLGPEYVFETKLYYSGAVLSDGSLEGDILIESSGDPSFASDRFSDHYSLDKTLDVIFKQLKADRINCIDGDIFIKLPFDAYPVAGSWPWEDLGNYYASGAWGLNYNENTYQLTFESPALEGEYCKILEIQPYQKRLKFNNMVVSGAPGSGDQSFILGTPYDHFRTIVGSIPCGKGKFQIGGSIPNPPWSFLTLVTDYLDEKGIRSEGSTISMQYDEPKTLIRTFTSPSLIDILKKCNDHSINLYSESLGKAMLIKKYDNMPAGYPSEKLWESLFTGYGLDNDKMKIVDACGLSPANLISPVKMTDFITVMVRKTGLETVKEILPASGIDGNARSFLRGKTSQKKLWIKSGSVENVLNYAGIFKSANSEKHYVFSIFSNNNTSSSNLIKREMEQFLDQMIRFSE